MPGCVLRVRSTYSDVESLVKASGLEPVVIHHKGQPRVPGAAAVSPSSGFNVDVSSADGRLDRQTRDAIRFLRRHAKGLIRLRRSRGFGGMALDFGVYDRTADRPWPSYRFPGPLVELAGKYGIDLALSFYGPQRDAG
jgi:hypothetical protein